MNRKNTAATDGLKCSGFSVKVDTTDRSCEGT